MGSNEQCLTGVTETCLLYYALPKIFRDDAGTVLQAETPGQPFVKDVGIVATLY